MLLSNYKEHPTLNNYLIFTYTKRDMADYFAKLLEEKGIAYKLDESEYGRSDLFLYAVKTSYRSEAVHCNFLAYGKYRKPLVSNTVIRYSLLTLFTGLMVLGVYSYFNRGAKTITKGMWVKSRGTQILQLKQDVNKTKQNEKSN